MERERLTQEMVSKTRRDVATRILLLSDDLTIAPRAAVIGLLDREASDDLAISALLRRLFIALAAIDSTRTGSSDDGPLSDVEERRLADYAADVLRVLDVRPRSSRFSFLHAELELARGHRAASLGRHGEALARFQTARSLATRGADQQLVCRLAVALVEALQRQGHGALAWGGLKHLLAAGGGEGEALEAKDGARRDLAALRAFRWSGRWRDWDALRGRAAGGAALSWEGVAGAARRGKGLDAVLEAKATDALSALRSRLWAYAERPSAFDDATTARRLRSSDQIKREHGLSLRSGGVANDLLRVVKTLDDCYDPVAPIERRIDAVEKLLLTTQELMDVEDALLTQVAAARWLKSVKQPLRAGAALATYHRLSWGLSQERTYDCLSIAAGLELDPWEGGQLFREAALAPKDAAASTAHATTKPRSPSAAVPRTTAGRGLRLAGIGLGLLPHLLRTKFKGFFSSRAEAQAARAAASEDAVRYLVERVGAMKGPVVKLAQMTSVVHAALPEPVYEAVMRIREEAPGLAPSVVRAVVQEELGRTVEDVFASWDDEPIASASIGQVHRATLRGKAGETPREVAVKVQHPGIEDGIRADVRLLRWLLAPLYRVWFPRVDFGAVAGSIESQVLAECDFGHEAEVQRAMRAQLGGHPTLIVPDVVTEASSRRVLTMDFVAGQRFSDFVASSTSKERDRAGLTIGTQLITDCFAGRPFNADPHPGNFLFLREGDALRIALIDFGATSRLAPDEIDLIRDILVAAAASDLATFRACYVRLARIAPDAPIDAELELGNARRVLQPLLIDDDFRFTYDFFDEIFAYYGLASPNRRYVGFQSALIPMWRCFIGLQILLCELEAKANWHRVFWTALRPN